MLSRVLSDDLQHLETIEAQIVKPLAVIISASGKDSVVSGSTFELSVTVCNKGTHSATIEVYIQEDSLGVNRWCKSGQKLLALGSNQSEEVVFEFDIPVDVLPGTYDYTVVVDAPEDYPAETPIQYQQYIQVLPGTSDIVRSSDPTFVIQPATTSQEPAVIPGGGAHSVQVFVHNRGERVDRFRLICSDLPKSWYRVIYPQNFPDAGLVLQTDCLNLNPGDSGQITLVITPPLNTLSGSYIPTLRLYSENNPELKLLDLLYLEVPPNYQLQAELRTVISRVKSKSGMYQVRLNNSGNTPRLVNLQVKDLDEEGICSYILEPSQAVVHPRQTVAVDVLVKPEKWWKRPFLGGAKILNFTVDLEDSQELPLLSDSFPGVLVWEARPWWQFLPFLLLALLGIGLSAYFIWWLLFRIPPSPKVFEFYPEDSNYSAVNDDVVHLGFAINHPSRLSSIKIVGLSADGKPLTRPETYDFSKGIPDVLQSSCKQQKQLLVCKNIRSNARKPGTYIFEMTAQPKLGKGAVPSTIKTNSVTITPIPSPKIISFNSTKATYRDSTTDKNVKAKSQNRYPNKSEIKLNWTTVNSKYLQSLQLVGRNAEGAVVSKLKTYDFSEGIPLSLRRNCRKGEPLVCKNVKTGIKKPGDYIFELRAIPKAKVGNEITTKKTEIIKILPKPIKIINFKINGKSAPAKYLIPIKKDKTTPPLTLSWKVDASLGTKVELLPAPGTVPLKGSIPFTLDPEPGSLNLMLQATSTTGEQVVRSVIIETYDPEAKDAAAATAEAVTKAIVESQQAQQKKAQEQKEKEQKEKEQKARNAAAKKSSESNKSDNSEEAQKNKEQQQTEQFQMSEEDIIDSKYPPSLSPIELPPQAD